MAYIKSPTQLIDHLRSTLVPRGNSDSVILRLRSIHHTYQFLEYSHAEVKEMIDEVEKMVLRYAVQTPSPLEKLALQILMGAAMIEPHHVTTGEDDGQNGESDQRGSGHCSEVAAPENH